MVNTVIKNAFRIIPMIPLVYHLLWFSWNGNCYFDMFLSLNASSSIFFSNLVQLYNRLLYQDTARGECLIFKTISVLFFHQIHNNDLCEKNFHTTTLGINSIEVDSVIMEYCLT